MTACQVCCLAAGVPCPSMWMTIATSPCRVSRCRSPRIIDGLNWCSTRSFWGSRFRVFRAASQPMTLLTSPMLTLPICFSGSCPRCQLPLRVQGQPDIGQLEQRLVAPGLGEQAGPARLQWHLAATLGPSLSGQAAAIRVPHISGVDPPAT